MITGLAIGLAAGALVLFPLGVAWGSARRRLRHAHEMPSIARSAMPSLLRSIRKAARGNA